MGDRLVRDCHRRVSIVEACAAVGARCAYEAFRTNVTVETKASKHDHVTEADRKTQRAMVNIIQENSPDATIVGEENGATRPVPDEGETWVIDPIDGTANFVRGSRQWATSVACLVDGAPVAAANVLPAMGDTYIASPTGVERNGERVTVSERTDPEQFAVVPTIWWNHDRRDEYAAATRAIVNRFGDLRRLGSAQAALSMLAAGGLEGIITNVETKPWDTVAGVGMVRWAGGTVTDLDGDPWRHDSRGLVASNGTAHETVLAAAREIDR